MDAERVRPVAEKHRAALDRIVASKAERDAATQTAKENFNQLVTELWNSLGQQLKEFCEHYNGHFETQQLYYDVSPDKIALKAPTPGASLTLKLSRSFETLKVHTSYGDQVDLHLRRQGPALIFVLDGREGISPEDVAHQLATALAEKIVSSAEEKGSASVTSTGNGVDR